MTRIIDINRFNGVWTNGDPVDIPHEYLVEQKNFYPKNGRILKTFGYGVKLDSATAQVLDQLSTYIESNLTLGGQSGEAYIGIYVAANNVVTVYIWNETLQVWAEISTLYTNWTGTYYHKNDTNPVLQIDQVLRLLPGNLGANGANECKGIWLGYIDSDFFDNNYEAGTDYTAAFFNYDSLVATPTVSNYVFANVDGGLFNTTTDSIDTYYYRLSNLYDGFQESLVSEAVGIKYGSNEHLKITFSLTMATHNLRQTGLKLYRSLQEAEISSEEGKPKETIQKQRQRPQSSSATRRKFNVEGETYTVESLSKTNFFHIMTIDFLREAGKFETSADGLYSCETGGGNNGYILVDNLPAGMPDGTAGVWTIIIGGNTYTIDKDPAVAELIVDITGSAPTSTIWNQGWEIQKDGGQEATDTDGAYFGTNVMILDASQTADQYIGGVLYADQTGTHPMTIVRNNTYAVEVLSHGTMVDDDKWFLMRPSDGLYFTEEAAGVVTYKCFDNRLTEGYAHPLEGEVSIKVNGKYSKYINNRLWQADIILNPGGTDEEAQPNWVSFSELFQPDVNPVSNVITMHDIIGSGCTGLHEILGNPVVLKNNAIITISVSFAPDNPSSWGVQESSHDIGNIAYHGSIAILDSIYVCYYDGIYEFKPNNLAESDRTPTNKLKISDPIGDVYQGVADKTAIRSGYDPVKNEIHFYLDTSNTWAYSIETQAWRQINSGQTFGLYASDENNGLMMYDSSDKKVYDLNTSESVAASIVTKTFEVSLDEPELIDYLAVTYYSVAALTCNVYYEDDIQSGSSVEGSLQNGIQGDVTYQVREKPYVDGSTFTVTYNGVAYTHLQTFTGVIGAKTYSTAGTGVVELFSTHTLPANEAKAPYFLRLARWAKRIRVEITSAAGTSYAEIDKVAIQLDK